MLKLSVLSGKGGVGKTTICVNLAYALRDMGKKIGIMDFDLTGPNVMRAIGAEESLKLDITKAKYIPIEHDGIKILSMANLLPQGKALLWEGIRRRGIVKEFIHAADWTGLDILLADLPPGCGDETLGMMEYFVPDGVIIVTTPHSLAYEDYLRAIDMLKLNNTSVIKTVVNMAYFDLKCPHKNCREKKHRISVFKDNDHSWENSFEVPFDPLISASNKVDLKELAKLIIEKMVVA